MMDKKYHEAMNKIQASDQFKMETLRKLESQKKERRYDMKNTRKLGLGVALFALLLVSIIGFRGGEMISTTNVENTKKIDLTDRIKVDPNGGVAGKAVVNIQGVIMEVGSDGLSFMLEDGLWVEVTDETEIGISGPTAAPKEEQLFEPTFRVGNSVEGFTAEDSEKRVKAYAIYTNWNWEDPIR